MSPMTLHELTIMNIALRLAGSDAVLRADMILETPFKNRPQVYAKAIAEGGAGQTEMLNWIKSTGLPKIIALQAKSRFSEKE